MLRSMVRSTVPSGEPWYPEMKVAVRSPRAASALCWSMGRRTTAWTPVSSTRPRSSMNF